jgi:hypothetical protein
MHTMSRPSDADGKPAAKFERMPCPLDPKHTVFVKDLKQHVLVCTRKRDEDNMKSVSLRCLFVQGNTWLVPWRIDCLAIQMC